MLSRYCATPSSLNPAAEQLATGGDNSENVVEVVRNTAGEPAHRFHFLGLPQ